MMTLEQAIESLYEQDFTDDGENIVVHDKYGDKITMWNLERENLYMQSQVDEIDFIDDCAHIYIMMAIDDMWN